MKPTKLTNQLVELSS